MGRFIVLLLVFIIIEFYCFQAVRQVTKNKLMRWGYVVVSLLGIIYIIYGFSQFDRNHARNHQSLVAGALVILFYLPKAIITILLITEDVVRIGRGIWNYSKGVKVKKEDKESFVPGRRKFVSHLAFGIASIPFISVLHGITIGRYKFEVRKSIIEFEDLPEAFDGFKFTHISDIHSGSFDNEEKVRYAVELINSQESDALLFTGDLVNSLADEMLPWYDVFNKIRHYKYGKYSILGNHDYGDYAHWDTEEERQKNFKDICDISPKLGFRLLRNEHVWFEKDGQRIAVVGVENWGVRGHFQKLGDLDKSTEGVNSKDFKILMSHDPSHWEAKILEHKKNFQLTLAGHTHGSQFGIEIPGFIKWSPIQYVYKQWAGLYEKMGKYIYVNRGFGYHAYQGRTGIWPEITVIELRRKK
ncbi:metallophosphoesterase [Myroides odoratimimus]|uniref:metallophosphoesterase n=1 Tax=Myroides odoratimimus TaxID=76832 RepID=UPI002576EDC4|nr:metallophosphoesterase [Myroides odoratimimus]MDM1409392.1 metallophosphoesterase [Myroides odoratimimus]